MTGLVFLHGWGFGPEVWSRWTDAFPGRPVALFDAGYFGSAQMTLPANPDGWIGVGHSLGFARLLSMNTRWRGLIGLGAFLRFCPAPGRNSGTPAEVLDAMLTRLDTAPSDVLTRFLRRCGLAGRPCALPDSAGLARLRADLLVLRGLDLCATPELLASAPPALLLHAADDRIASAELAREAQAMLPGSHLHVFENGTHALPVTRPDECLALAEEFLRATA
jgi:pimeloyl-[acyl-carrier protein] methyl ester esterase